MIQAKRAYVKGKENNYRWWGVVLLIIGMYLVCTLGKGVFELRTANRRINEARQVLQAEEAVNQSLKKKLANVQTIGYIEKVARNDLNMQKEGETVVVIPVNSPQSSVVSSLQVVEKDISNWRKWWSLVK